MLSATLVSSRADVLRSLESFVVENLPRFLKPIDENWQPADLLPDSRLDSFFDEVRDLRARAQELNYDLLAVLIGDTITEEALPNYETWFVDMKDLSKAPSGGWMRWVRGWTAEENRHGDALNRYLYLSGRVNMREFEASTQYLINDGFDLGTAQDPYRAFVYTSFQEMATNLSHRRVATLAKQAGDTVLSRLCGQIAADESRHARAYQAFVTQIFAVDPSQMMLALEDMMRKKIVMPAHYLRELGIEIGRTFGHFTDAAQRLGVYTSHDYTDILEKLLLDWRISELTQLTDAAERARDYLLALPQRLRRVADRIPTPQLEYRFRWIS